MAGFFGEYRHFFHITSMAFGSKRANKLIFLENRALTARLSNLDTQCLQAYRVQPRFADCVNRCG